MAQRSPVTIEKKGRPVAVVMSLEDYAHFQQLEDQVWAMKAQQAEKGGFLSEKETQKFLDDL